MSETPLSDASDDVDRDILLEVEDANNVVDTVEEQTAPSHRFYITSFGADLSVFDLIRRIGKDLLIPPAFQRKFVWTQKQASRFIESMLMGLPVPGIFIFGERGRQQLIVDGQQRLTTLDRFLKTVWEERSRKHGEREVQVSVPFRLLEVAEPWNGKTFEELSSDEQETINSYLIHATVFRQDGPPKNDRSIYEVFERINTGGSKLFPQEIRACVSHGPFVEFLHELNKNEKWREIYGKPSPRLKDEELILRFFAFRERGASYKRPMTVFLDEYLEDRRGLGGQDAEAFQRLFAGTIALLHQAVGPRTVFRPGGALNAAVWDAVMVGCAARLEREPGVSAGVIQNAYSSLLGDAAFRDAYTRATADDENVKTRLAKAAEYFLGS
jgi:hypothetical protein